MSASFEVRLSPGTRVGGHYEVHGQLGAGSMSTVYEAHDHALNRRVALKFSQHPQALAHEAQALAAIASPLVPAVFCTTQHEGRPVLVMERIYGTTLEALLEQRRASGSRLSIDEILDVLSGLADGLVSVHRAGVAHRDIKPANIILSPGNRVVLLDFGVVLSAAFAGQATPVAGTPIYMAPEQFLGRVEPSKIHLLDTYALGILGWELLVGHPPFDGEVHEVIGGHVADAPADLRELRPDVPQVLSALVGAMISKKPTDRPPSMELLARQLRSIRATARTNEAGFGVLIVDDEPAMQRLFQRFVHEAAPACEVRVASSTREALRCIAERPPQLLLLDLHLPDQHGVELCLTLRCTHAADACRIVPISARLTEHDQRLLRQLGIGDFIAKDIAAHDRVVSLVTAELHQWSDTQLLRRLNGGG